MKSIRVLAILGLVVGLQASMSSDAHAQVGGNAFNVEVQSTVSGDFVATLTFAENLNTDINFFAPLLVIVNREGNFFLLAEDGTTGAGLYSESGAALLGGLIVATTVDAIGGNAVGYVGSFTASYFTIGGIPFLTTLTGEGSGNAGDEFTFSN